MKKTDESYDEMKILLKDSDYAFAISMEGGVINSDFADYTSNNFITGFRHVLQKPDLSRAQLASMLRAADRRSRRRKNDINWAESMAAMVTKKANTNGEENIF